MTVDYLLLLHIGPVQDFIAKARRTRDLWFGSFVLSEISKAGADYLHQQNNVELIFPYSDDLEEILQASKGQQDNDHLGIANRILARYQGDAPNTILEDTAKVIKARWQVFADEAKKECQAIIAEHYWDKQIMDVLEIYFSWMPIEENYRAALEKLQALDQARQNTKNFQQSTIDKRGDGYGLMKSSLDAAHETVIRTKKSYRRFGLAKKEELDAVGMVKRLGGDPEQFVAISRLALDPWLRNIAAKNTQDLEVVKNFFEENYSLLNENDLLTRVKIKPFSDVFPFDGNLVFLSRIEAEKMILERDQEEGEDIHLVKNKLDALKKILRPLYEKYGEPCPYMAIIQADGDKMGRFIDAANTQAEHQQFSLCLNEFTKIVKAIFNRHAGQAIYSGGDDVLGFVALDQTVACANKLKEDFGSALKEIAETLKVEAPTLSIGVAISHISTPLGYFRELAKRAEKAAKGALLPEAIQRDALAILLNIRSGREVIYRLQWQVQPVEHLQCWQSLYNHTLPKGNNSLEDLMPIQTNQAGLLPNKIAFALQALSQDLRNLNEAIFMENVDLLPNELERVLKHRSLYDHKLPTWLLAELKARFKDLQYLYQNEPLTALNVLADELFIARWLAQRVND